MTPVSADPSFEELLGRLRNGDDDAAAEIFQHYASRLIALARGRLDQQVRRKVDAEDVVQSVFKSFFLRHAEGQYDLSTWNSLWGLLVVITVRKCSRKVKKYHGPEHDVRKEAAGLPWASSDTAQWEAIAREPTPAEALILSEVVEELMRGLDERDRQILTLRLQGNTAPEIGAEVGLTQYTVEGVLKQVRKRLRKIKEQA
jgi:RNA polymerase sigma-70 factor, ECF subfamily